MLFLRWFLNKCQVVRNIIRRQRVPWRVMPFSWRMRHIWVQMFFLWWFLNKCQVVQNIIRRQRVPWRVMPFSCIYSWRGVNSYSTACTQLCTVTPTSFMYTSDDEYLHWTIYSRRTFSSLPLPFVISIILLQWAWGQLLFYYGQYASVYGYAAFLHVQIYDEYLCWIIYSRKTFSLLPLPFFILIIYYVQYASVYGYTDFLHVQIMERVDIYDKYSFKKQKWCKNFHSTLQLNFC